MTDREYDVLVVGSGPGGKHAAIAAAHLGKRVGIIERKPKLGGVSLQSGTIPSKALREAAYLHSRFAGRGMRSALGPGSRTDDHAFLQEAIFSKNTLIDKQEAILVNQLMRNGISIIPGEASFHDSHTLAVKKPGGDTQHLSADFIILATGSRPRRPENVPFDRQFILDSTGALKLERLPDSLIVVGGGVIACELATLFAPMGVKITIIDSHPRLLDYLDSDITAILVEHMQDMNIDLHMLTRAKSISYDNRSVTLVSENDEEFHSSHLIYAMGRTPNLKTLNVEKISLPTEDSGDWLIINEHFQTGMDHIFAIGDLAGKPSLAATAMEQARMVIARAYNQPYEGSHAPLPMAIYTIPELSYVGATERELKAGNAEYVVGRASFAETARGQIIGSEKGHLKLLADRNTRQILGVHIIGESASELIHIGQMAMGFNGTVDNLAANVYNYPTLAECYKSAALDCLNQLNAGS